MVLVVFGDSIVYSRKVVVNHVANHTQQFDDLSGFQIQAKELENLSEFISVIRERIMYLLFIGIQDNTKIFPPFKLS